ncbi:MAG: hypothetical protein BWY92_00669 [Firmicutes bacterium ADurb.BinA052]|nr:MAG: hypothetical protein BWY92_00669 [Firmicutes bacterium ADurb.BinA052]
MDRHYHDGVGEVAKHIPQSAADVAQRLSYVLTPVRGYQNQASSGKIDRRNPRVGKAVAGSGNGRNRIDYSVPCDVYVRPGEILPQQVSEMLAGRSKMQVGKASYEPSVHLFRKRVVLLIGPKPGLDMSNLDSAVE